VKKKKNRGEEREERKEKGAVSLLKMRAETDGHWKMKKSQKRRGIWRRGKHMMKIEGV